jgi:hypothetical protein
MARLTQKEIEKDMSEAQKVFFRTCATSAYYLNINGMKIDAVRNILHRSLDECIDSVEKRRSLR